MNVWPLGATVLWMVAPVPVIWRLIGGSPWGRTAAMLSWLPWTLATVYVFGGWLVRRNRIRFAGGLGPAGFGCGWGAPAAERQSATDAGEPNNRTTGRASIRLHNGGVG